MPEIITRQEALARGLKRYFTGKPCRRSHIAERLTNGSACTECRRSPESIAYRKAWDAANPEKLREKTRRYDHANREARRLAAKARREADPEKHPASVKASFRKHREKTLARGRAYRAANPEKRLDLNRDWHDRHPGARCAYENARRARKREAPGSYTPGDLQELLRRQSFKCVGCFGSIRKQFQADHIVPLSRGGANDIRNIQLLCPSCNRKKYAKDPIVWAQENGRLPRT
jgi:5-methylcytosine-specific restriction endonuclease McrA